MQFLDQKGRSFFEGRGSSSELKEGSDHRFFMCRWSSSELKEVSDH
ncbi:hypothetical protein DsansV1_C10g0104151 [Dioscorea sansibarensis]